MNDVGYVDNVLLQGASHANKTAHTTLTSCKDAMGFVCPSSS
jgi:hypothetical protein